MSGVKVLEFGWYVAGPMLGMLLADQGADVVKIERPEGDPARSQPGFHVWNRGKKSVVLDLKTDQGRHAAIALAQKADILIENFRPGVMDRLGLGYGTMIAHNPRLVYVSQPGFGPRSPYRLVPGWETLVCASTGLYQEQRRRGAPRGEGGGGGPSWTALPLASVFAAAVGAPAALAALWYARKTGKGQHVEVPLQDALVVGTGQSMVRAVLPGGGYVPRLGWVSLGTGGMHKTKDGRYINASVREENEVRRMAEAMDPAWVEPIMKDWYAGNEEAGPVWAKRISERFLTKTGEEWERILGPAVPAPLVRTVDEWLENEHALATQQIIQVKDPVLGPMKQAGIQYRLHDSPGAVRGPAPRLGQDTEEVLTDLAMRKG
jgi:crotonobetainyl-CoA:carnitine CoA-transferase CaiB-like acyl-CoA transferase